MTIVTLSATAETRIPGDGTRDGGGPEGAFG